MARAISDEEIQLKRRARRRLIGAVVLVTAIIVVLPMVLDSEPKSNDQEIKVQIPSTDSGAFAPKVAPTAPGAKVAPKAVDPAPAKAPEGAKSAAVTPGAPEKPAVIKEAATEAPKEAPKPEAPKPTLKAETDLPKETPAKPAAKPAAKKAKSAAKAPEGKFVVQVIALADAGRAKEMQGQIAAAGIKSYTEVVKTAKGDVTRVRAGPFATRQQAEKARDQLKALGMSGNIATR
jgi:DedD protein